MRVLSVFMIFCLSFTVQADEKKLLILGDSISAGYGIELEQGWVSLLQERLHRQGYPHKVINASISGDTSSGALQRLDKLLTLHNPHVCIVELGGNDGLRGLSLEQIADNLTAIVDTLQQSNSKILLVPMKLPPNYGRAYNQRFEKIYSDLADQKAVELSTFILEDVADRSDLMQNDGIHPLAEAQQQLLDNVWPQLQPLLNVP